MNVSQVNPIPIHLSTFSFILSEFSTVHSRASLYAGTSYSSFSAPPKRKRTTRSRADHTQKNSVGWVLFEKISKGGQRENRDEEMVGERKNDVVGIVHSA